MKKGASEKIVRVKGGPKLTEAQIEELKRLAEMPDEEIDFSDIPEITDFSGFEVGKFYRPVKETKDASRKANFKFIPHATTHQK